MRGNIRDYGRYSIARFNEDNRNMGVILSPAHILRGSPKSRVRYVPYFSASKGESAEHKINSDFLSGSRFNFHRALKT